MPTIGQAVNAVNTAINVVNAAGDVADTAVRSANVVAKYVSPRSITRLAKDSIFEFPMFISSSIDTDEVFVMAKSVERNYAQLMVSVISLYSYVNLAKYHSIVEYLRKFHSNGSFGGRIGEEFAVESASENGAKVTLESAVIDGEAKVINVNMESLWDSAIECLDTGNFNDMYKPYLHSKALLENALEKAKSTIANEAIGVRNDVIEIDNPDKNIPPVVIGQHGKDATNAFHAGDADGNFGTRYANARNVNALVRDDVTSNLSPTMVNLSFVMDANAAKDGKMWTQSVVIGIKAMTRLIRPSSMISNITEACQNRAIFKFINFTSGEKSVGEILLNAITGPLKKGYDSTKKNDERWINILKKRKASDLKQRLIGHQLLPNATIIMTEQEAMAVKDACGIDITNASIARKVIEKYFLLGIGIYDTEAKVLDILYDGDSSFQSVSMRYMIADNKKVTDVLTNMNKF